MLYLLSFGLLFLSRVNGDEDDHDHDDHDHDGEYTDCECVTGITTDDLDCDADDFDEDLSGLQEYLRDHNCKQYCKDQEYIGTTASAYECLQVWFLIGQYHDYCVSGSVNESLFHDYLDVCPDCAQEYFYYEGAETCANVTCDDTDAQEAAIDYVIENCSGEDDTCTDLCSEKFIESESYHRLCDHDDISEAFDEAFDKNPWLTTTCTVAQSHCNVEDDDDHDEDEEDDDDDHDHDHDHAINCSAPLNKELYNLKIDNNYGDLDVEDVLDHDHDHGSANGYFFTVLAVSITSFLAAIFVQ